MTITEAYRILGLPPGTGNYEVKKRYRKLMTQVHPDVTSEKRYAYSVQEINMAYGILKELSPSESDKENASADHITEELSFGIWNAPVNPNAYRSREIFQYVEDYDGSILGHICVGRGKYLWTPDEDFPLFLLSMYRLGIQILDELDTSLKNPVSPSLRGKIQPELTYLLAQQFLTGSTLLHEFAKKEESTDDSEIFYVSAMLEPVNRRFSSQERKIFFREGEFLSPARLSHHRLYLKNQDGQEVGYLSFPDDRLYYVVIPLFEQKLAQVKIQAAAGCQPLHLWIKLNKSSARQLPENLNVQIERLLKHYLNDSTHNI